MILGWLKVIPCDFLSLFLTAIQTLIVAMGGIQMKQRDDFYIVGGVCGVPWEIAHLTFTTEYLCLCKRRVGSNPTHSTTQGDCCNDSLPDFLTPVKFLTSSPNSPPSFGGRPGRGCSCRSRRTLLLTATTAIRSVGAGGAPLHRFAVPLALSGEA